MEILPGRSYLLLGEPPAASQLPGLMIDRLTVEGAVAIKDLRLAISQMSQKPHGRLRLLYLTEADQLNEVCQNTLLKALEEPAAQAAIVLQTTRPARLLSTITSRLQVIDRRSADRLTPSLAIELDSVKEAKDRPAAIIICAHLLNGLTNELMERPARRTLGKIKLLEETIVRLRSNANFRLTVNYLLLRWPSD